MLSYIGKRLVSAIIILFGISIVVFILMRLIPGDVIDVKLGTFITSMTDNQIADMKAFYGLDKPIYIQYATWISSLFSGNMGVSFSSGQPVLDEIIRSYPVTIELTILGMIIGVTLGVVFGVVSANKRGTIVDSIARVLGITGLSLPVFWVGTLLILVCSLYFRWIPQAGELISFVRFPIENLKQMILPAVCLGIALAAAVMRTLRSSMLEIMQQDYIRTARSKGIKERYVIYRHCLKNAMIPAVTIIGIQAGQLLGGTAVIEQIFGLPGIGSLTVNAILERDYPMVQATIMVIAINYLVINFVVDIIYALLDPRISLVESK